MLEDASVLERRSTRCSRRVARFRDAAIRIIGFSGRRGAPTNRCDASSRVSGLVEFGSAPDTPTVPFSRGRKRSRSIPRPDKIISFTERVHRYPSANDLFLDYVMEARPASLCNTVRTASVLTTGVRPNRDGTSRNKAGRRKSNVLPRTIHYHPRPLARSRLRRERRQTRNVDRRWPDEIRDFEAARPPPPSCARVPLTQFIGMV